MDQLATLDYEKTNKESKEVNSEMGNSLKNSNSINYTHTSADEIFQILSQKIAKYCQILSDLTNCEVFFKSNLNNRSLYWGTYKMMFNYSHQGLHYDRNDSLIRISGRSLSNDIANIVEELLNVENFDKATNNNTSSLSNDHLEKNFNNKSINEIEIKDCIVYMDRLDEQLYEHYLQKLEKSRVFIEDEVSLNEMYSNLCNQNNFESVKEDKFICEICKVYAYKHLPELKLHILKEHEKIEFSNESPFKCLKCNFNCTSMSDHLNHVLLCYYPDIFRCEICHHAYNTYSEYQYHIKYFHNTVYDCSLCLRRFKTAEELMEHDQFMHSKTVNFCEICFESLNSRRDLQEHYKDKHVNNENIEDNSNFMSNYEKISTTINKIKTNKLNNDQVNVNKISYKSYDSSIDHSVSTIDNDSNSSKPNNEENEKSEIDDNYTYNTKSENKMQKNELIRGLLDRKHQCKWCAQRFFTKSQLRQHESTHTNTVLYCPVCDKEFTHKDRLTGHMKCHMEPSLECKVCGKKFKRLCNLYNHELVHGLTEHAFMLCQFCGRGFRSRRDYQNHVIANHRDQLMKSEIIKNSNNILSDNFNSSTSSILAENFKNNLCESTLVNNSIRDTFSNDNKDEFYAQKNHNNDNNGFIEKNDDKISGRKKNKYDHSSNDIDKFNVNNTQLLVKAAEFVDNNVDKNLTS